MANCPRCGFEIGESGVCPVCGKSKQATGGDPSVTTPARTGKAVSARTAWAGRPVLWIGALVVLLAAAGGYLAVSLGRSASAESSPAPAAAILPPADRPAAVNDPPPPPISAQAPSAYDISRRAELPPTDTKQSYVDWMLAHTSDKEPYLSDRWDRAQIALGRGDITQRRVLTGFLLTPREEFVRKYNLPRAYADAAIPIGYGQTISGPHIVARMTNALDPRPDMKVLEIGTGSGYQAAFLSELSNHVYTIEIVEPLAKETDALYTALADRYPMYANIKRRAADGYYGWPEAAPFDRIIVTCAIDHIPPDLLKQLAPGGVMVIPVGPPSGQVVLSITKVVDPDGTVRLEREDIYHGAAKKIFVPFTATGGGIHSAATDQTGKQQ